MFWEFLEVVLFDDKFFFFKEDGIFSIELGIWSCFFNCGICVFVIFRFNF